MIDLVIGSDHRGFQLKQSIEKHILPVDKDIEKLQNEVAKKLGYKLVDHKLELYGSKIKK